MMAACKKLGMKIPTSCKKGDCGTCTVNVGGKNIKACVGKVPPAPKLKSVLEKGLPVRKEHQGLRRQGAARAQAQVCARERPARQERTSRLASARCRPRPSSSLCSRKA